ncbi:MAG: hypothetical protein JWO05_869 [Gemmatimonadetes bacterium]|nr:hypothetical protein [Gemmatimonadota bacterium]
MHWLLMAARRAGIPGADLLSILPNTPLKQAWIQVEAASKLETGELVERLATVLRVHPALVDRAENKALKLVPEKLARRFSVFPMREDDRNLVVATADPNNLDAEQALSFASGRNVVFALATPSQIEDRIAGAYSPDLAVESLLLRMDAQLADAVEIVDDSAPEQLQAAELESTPVVRITNLVLREGITQGASDIHIEPGMEGGVVRFRIDGVMRQHMHLPMQALNRIVSRIKVLTKLDIADRLRPQDGRTRVVVEGKAYDLRISTIPTRDAEKAVIRILRTDGAKTLAASGLPATELARLRQLLGMRDGIVAVTGPTGSGKTTTLYAAIRELATGDVNVMTVEDPVEYQLAGITQMQIDTKRNVTFASALRAILRQDPDVIFVGEIRDDETATIAVQAAMTGHLVLATLHTNDSLAVVPRLVDLGLDRATIAAALRGAVAQRLIRRLCAECAVAAEEPLTPEEQRLANAYRVRPKLRAVGCAKCGMTGFRGRVAVAEVAVITPAMVEQIAGEATVAQLRKSAIAAGMRPMLEVALDRVRDGTTTLAEVERVIGEATAEGTPETPMSVPIVPASEASGERGPTRILVVDDDPVARRLASAVLELSGYTVETAADVAETEQRLSRGEPYDLIITDLEMPGGGGQVLLAKLRSKVSTAGIPVIVLTGAAADETETVLIEAGADDYIRKPLDPPRFLARVKATLRRAGL